LMTVWSVHAHKQNKQPSDALLIKELVAAKWIVVAEELGTVLMKLDDSV
jgi:hypothetical protein